MTCAIGEVRPLLAQRGYTVAPGVRLRTRRGHRPRRRKWADRDHRWHRDPGRRPAAGRKDRDKFISGKSKQNAVKAMVVTDADGQVLFCSPTKSGSCADITQARQFGLVKVRSAGPAVEILADAGYQGLGAQTGGRVVTPPASQVQEERPGLVGGDA